VRAAVLHGIGDLRIEGLADPVPVEGELLIRVRSVGVCGSDVHYYAHGRIGDVVVTSPHILGHETAGEVVDVPDGVTGLELAYKVAIEPGIPCRDCPMCRTGRYNLCPDIKFLGHPPTPGAYTELIAYPAAWCHRIPEALSFDDGAMIEPLAIAVFAIDEAPVQTGHTVAIFGCGPIGLLIMQVARAAGAGKVLVSEPIKERRQFALKLGADAAFDPRDSDIVANILEATAGQGVDLAVEAAGAPDTYAQAIDVARRDGTALFVGIPEEDAVSIPIHTARRRAVTIVNLRRFRGTYPRAIDLVTRGKVDVRTMATHRFALDNIDQAFQLVQNYGDGVVRAMIEL